MVDLLQEPLPTELFDTPRDLRLESDSAYLFSLSVEDRSRLAPDWMQMHPRAAFVEISTDEARRTQFDWESAGKKGNVRLRSEADLDSFLSEIGRKCVYLDITGLPHFVWVPVLRSLLRLRLRAKVVYAEPKGYVLSRSSSAELYELSDRISNAEPLPGFASLTREVEAPVLVSLLGFEGARFARVQQVVQTRGDLTFPIIGVPGFEPEYPFITYFANRFPLYEDNCWLNLDFASANCPFSLLTRLEHLAINQLPEHATIKVALIGTKPHAVGAVLFFLRSERDVELIYDHPVRRAGRTTGSKRCWVYTVSDLSYRQERLTSKL